MLTGEVAFSGASTQATIARRFIHTPPSVTSSRDDVSTEVSELVARLLEKEPGDRHATGAQVVTALRASTGISGPRVTVPRPDQSAAEKSIAVLPFTNMSADADKRVLRDCLTEEIITGPAG